MSPFLRTTPIINWDHPEILALASYLSKQSPNPHELIIRSFHWVQTQIIPDAEYQSVSATLKASDILIKKRGCCFGKSHLLAALLRANGISAGLAYQRVPDLWNGGHRLHALNSVYVPHAGWFDLDTWGTEGGGQTICLPRHYRAFPEAERIRGIWPGPLNCVVEALLDAQHVGALYRAMQSEDEAQNHQPEPGITRQIEPPAA